MLRYLADEDDDEDNGEEKEDRVVLFSLGEVDFPTASLDLEIL
jgi:hypothetical protein